jgi:hypothetical protein
VTEGGEGESLSWDDIPLLKYESELLIRCGAWKSIWDLEESLTMEELFLLYKASNYEFNLQVKGMAASQGADVDWDEDWYDDTPPPPPEVVEKQDLRFIPIGLGYEA